MNKIFTMAAIVVLVSGGIYYWQSESKPQDNPLGEKVVVYKTPACGCCSVYVKYLKKSGVEVEVIDLDDLVPIKKDHGVTADISSCHTSIVGGYVVEGHVPLNVIEKLLLEKPEIKGIALPGMPSGTPGMPGPKTSEWIVYAIGHDGEISEYIRM